MGTYDWYKYFLILWMQIEWWDTQTQPADTLVPSYPLESACAQEAPCETFTTFNSGINLSYLKCIDVDGEPHVTAKENLIQENRIADHKWMFVVL